MKFVSTAAIVIGMAGGIVLGQVGTASAQDIGIGVAVPGFNFSFNTGDVAYAYSDGYWDHDHHWHKWRDEREAREYRTRYADHYDEHRHDRVANDGWREERREEHHEEHHDHD